MNPQQIPDTYNNIKMLVVKTNKIQSEEYSVNSDVIDKIASIQM